MSESDHRASIELFDAILLLRNSLEVENFFKDLCTPQELSALRERWKVCQMLEEQRLSYREIHSISGSSLTTIGRVARFLRDESYGGYRLILRLLKTGE